MTVDLIRSSVLTKLTCPMNKSLDPSWSLAWYLKIEILPLTFLWILLIFFFFMIILYWSLRVNSLALWRETADCGGCTTVSWPWVFASSGSCSKASLQFIFQLQWLLNLLLSDPKILTHCGAAPFILSNDAVQQVKKDLPKHIVDVYSCGVRVRVYKIYSNCNTSYIKSTVVCQCCVAAFTPLSS